MTIGVEGTSSKHPLSGEQITIMVCLHLIEQLTKRMHNAEVAIDLLLDLAGEPSLAERKDAAADERGREQDQRAEVEYERRFSRAD
jgi:hypothetical protein